MKSFARACGISYNAVRRIAARKRDGNVKTFFALADVIAEGLEISRAEAMARLRDALE
jgi:hypothetical protein